MWERERYGGDVDSESDGMLVDDADEHILSSTLHGQCCPPSTLRALASAPRHQMTLQGCLSHGHGRSEASVGSFAWVHAA
eukprot:233950-Rhodomonas_salina.1